MTSSRHWLRKIPFNLCQSAKVMPHITRGLNPSSDDDEWYAIDADPNLDLYTCDHHLLHRSKTNALLTSY